MKIIITGFGPFARVKDNPSERLAETLVESLKKDTEYDCECVKLGVSCQDVDNFYSELKPNSDVFVLHIGLYEGANKLCLEKYARNRKNFLVGDARGYQPKDEAIDPSKPKSWKLTNAIDIEKLQKDLGSCFEMSTDAGEYVCNYAFYRGLANTGSLIRGCIFLHIPLFSVIPWDKQQLEVLRLVKAIFALFAGEQQTHQ